MKLMNGFKGLSMVTVMLFMVGCSGLSSLSGSGSTSALVESSQGSTSGSGAQTYGVDVGGISGSVLGQGTVLNDKNKRIKIEDLQTVFYFQYDRSTLSEDSIKDLALHAKYLKEHPMARIRLDGHADERGTREYNMALGERRGLSVSQHLKINGASKNQLEVISYGEEKPAVMGSNGADRHQLNRRVELRYEVK